MPAPQPAAQTPRAVPPSPDEVRARFAGKVVNLATPLTVAIMLGYALAYLARGQWALGALELMAAAAVISSYLLGLRDKKPLAGLQRLAAATWLVLALIIVLHGGLRSPAVLWLAMLAPLMFLAGAPIALPLAGLSAIFLIALYGAEVAGWLPAYAEVPLLQRAISASLALLLFVVFARNAQDWRQGIADELIAARDAALESGRLKDRFIANLNHELRTPLNAMIGSAQLLARRSQDPQQQILLQALRRSADHLLVLVNDVLDHSRLEAGMMQIERIPFSLLSQLEDAAAMFAPAAQAKSLTLERQLDPALADLRLGDPTRLRQVVANLLSNAIKFTTAGGVTLRARDETGEGAVLRLRLEVEDSGPGIADAVRERLFDPFAQADASIGRKHGGTGLGLTICRELVQLMGGQIRAEAGSGGGALFVAQLPLPLAAAPVAAPSPEPALAAAPGRRDRRVLLVEDNPVNLMVVQAMLQSLGAQVLTAQGGEEALAMLEHEPFDLVLMDLQMPGIDGITATRMRREHERARGLAATRIIALTGEAHEAARRDCAAAGMNGFLSKPISLDDLDVVLQRLQAAA